MASETELQRLYEEHAQALFAFVLNMTRNEEDARDILQDIFIRLARDSNPLKGVRSERSFLLRSAHNSVIDLLRRRGTREKYHERAVSEQSIVFAPTSHPDEASFREVLSIAMAELPEEQRAVIHLKLWEEFTFEAVAEALGIPANTAASRYRYALDKLRARLRPVYDELKDSTHETGRF